MKRVIFNEKTASIFFENYFKKANLPKFKIADYLEVSCKTLHDWSKAKYSVPLFIIEKIIKHHKLYLPDDVLIKDDSEIKGESGKIGGFVRYKKYGNFGTKNGRSKGGQKSCQLNQKLQNGFIKAKAFPTLKRNDDLAEFIGIMIGDGTLSKYQARITLNKDDKNYIKYVSNLVFQLTGYTPHILRRKENAVDIVISGTNFVKQLAELGLVIGNKNKQGITIPCWVFKRANWLKRTLKGIYDTDGCLFMDNHQYKGKKYQSYGIAFTSYSDACIARIARALTILGYSPTLSTKHRVMLRKKDEIINFCKEIKPANIKAGYIN